jgi:mono/diheme cytochrome c family protein
MNLKFRSRAGFGLLNTLLLVGGAALLAWGGLYVGKYSGRFDPQEFSELPYGPPAKLVAVAADPNAAVITAGLAVYNRPTCAACHQADGLGNLSLSIPPLAGSDWVLADGPNRLIRVVLHGLKGPIKLNGQDFNTSGVGAMNPWGQSPDNPAGLTAKEIAEVLSYIRNAWGNKASIITEDQVKAVIDAEKGRDASEAWTAEELDKIPVSGGGAPSPVALTVDQLKEALKKLPASDLKSLLDAVQAN